MTPPVYTVTFEAASRLGAKREAIARAREDGYTDARVVRIVNVGPRADGIIRYAVTLMVRP